MKKKKGKKKTWYEPPTQCYLLREPETEREAVRRADAFPTSLLRWQERMAEKETMFQKRSQQALERAKDHELWVISKLSSPPKEQEQEGKQETERNKTNWSLRRRREGHEKLWKGVKIPEIERKRRTAVITKHPEKYTVGVRFDQQLLDGRVAHGTIVDVFKSFSPDTPSILTIELDPLPDYTTEHIAAYDLETRLRSIQALDDNFESHLRVFERDTSFVENQNERDELKDKVRRKAGRFPSSSSSKTLWSFEPQPNFVDDLLSTQETVQRAIRDTKDAELYKYYVSQYGELCDDLFVFLSHPGKAYHARVQFASRKISIWLRYHSQRRAFLLNFLVLKLQSVYRGRKEREWIAKLRKKHAFIHQGFFRHKHRVLLKCFEAWREEMQDSRERRRKLASFLLVRQQRVLNHWRGVKDRIKATRFMLRERRRIRRLKALMSEWREKTVMEKKVLLMRERSAHLRQKKVFQVWAEMTAAALFQKLQLEHHQATLIQSVWRMYVAQRQRRHALQVVVQLQALFRGKKLRSTFFCPFGPHERLKRKHAKRKKRKDRKARHEVNRWKAAYQLEQECVATKADARKKEGETVTNVTVSKKRTLLAVHIPAIQTNFFQWFLT